MAQKASTKRPNAGRTKRIQKRFSDSLSEPKSTKVRLMDAACGEFAERGLSGARVDTIAAKAGLNKQLLYYYFGDKENLYKEVLEKAYADIRVGEQELALERLPPRAAMSRFIEFTFDYLIERRYFVALLNDENIHKARHIKGSVQLQHLHKRLKKVVGGTLKRGLADGSFKRNVDPIDLYISIASLCYFYHSNNYTLSAVFGRDLSSAPQVRRRRKHIVEFVISYLTSPVD